MDRVLHCPGARFFGARVGGAMVSDWEGGGAPFLMVRMIGRGGGVGKCWRFAEEGSGAPAFADLTGGGRF